MKVLQTVLCVAFLAVHTWATDVTIGATTQPNFNPTGLQSAVTLTGVTVTNGTNALLTCAACFRPQWVGMGGFYITVGVQNYYVKNVDSTSQATLTGGRPETSPATVVWHPYVEYRIYADRAFQPLGKTYIVQPGTPGTGAWYKRYGASVITVSGVRTLYIPELVIDATTDAVGPTNQARYTAAFYRPDNSLVQIYACADQFRVPPVTPTSWTALCQFNSPPAIVPPANEAYTKAQIDARLLPCSTGQMIYYAVTGNQPACLTVGTGLTISNASILTTGGTPQAINIVTDYNCDPDDDGGSVDQTCFQSAINAAAAAGGKTVYVPTGVYNVSGLSIPGGVTVIGDGRNRSIIKSATNAAIVSLVEGAGAYVFTGPTLKQVGITGTVTSGTSQTGLYATDDASIFNVRVDSVDILDTGGDGLFVGKTYSSMFSDLYISNNQGFPVLYDAATMPQNVFDKIYVGLLRTSQTGASPSTAPQWETTAFRIKAGEFTCRGCNGVNNVIGGSAWAVVGKKAAVDGSNGAAKFTCIDCNLESWVAYGVVSYYGSTVNLRGQTTVQMDIAGISTGKAIQFDLANNGVDYYSELIMRGYIEDTVQFTQQASSYANSQAIHSNGIPPLQTLGRGPEIVTAGSPDRISTFYNSTASAVGYLARADSLAEKITVTATTALTGPGVRYIEANCGSACTITIPWAGNYQVSDVITIKDIGSAVTNNVTINTAGGGTINGVSSYVMSRNKEALVLRADSTGDWRIVSLYQPNSYGVRQAVNAADYGCDLTDNGTNDTACLVAAIAAAQASGGKTLYLPTGTYNTDAITANVNGLIIEGDGPYRSIIKARGSNYNVINVTTPAYGYGLNLRDLGVRGAGKAVGTSGHCIYIKDTNSYLSEFKFENLSLIDCRQDALNIPYIFSGIIERVTTDEVGEDHIDIGALGGSNTVTLLNNYVKTVEAWRVGFRIRAAGAILMSNNGMAPDSASSAFWGLFGQKYITATATMASGNTQLTSVASGGGFNPGDEVILTNGVSSGVHLRTVVTAVNVAGNTVTLLNAPTNTGTTVLGTTDGASSGAVMTSGNATLANVTNAADFEVGNGVYITNGTSSGVNLTTTISSINVNANTITLAAAPTNSGPTIIAIDSTSYYRGPLLNNNIEDFGTYGVRLKENSRFGSISGNSFLSSPASISHIALKYDFAGAGFDNAGGGTTPAGFWDASNTLMLGGGTWANSQPIHSQAVPFLVAGEQPKQYYETSFGFAVDLPALASSWDSTEQKMLLRIPGVGTQNLKLGQESAVTGKALFMNAANGNRLYLQAGTTSATTTFTLPTAAPAGNDYLLKSSTAGVMGWTTVTGTGNAVLATSPTITSPILNNTVFGSLSGSATDGTVIICTDCKPNATTGTCEGSGNGSLAMRISGAWKCN